MKKPIQATLLTVVVYALWSFETPEFIYIRTTWMGVPWWQAR